MFSTRRKSETVALSLVTTVLCYAVVTALFSDDPVGTSTAYAQSPSSSSGEKRSNREVQSPAPYFVNGRELQPIEFVVIRTNREQQVTVLGTRLQEVEIRYDMTTTVISENDEEALDNTFASSNPKTVSNSKTVVQRNFYEKILPGWRLSRVDGQRVSASKLPRGDTPAILLRDDVALSNYHRNLFSPETLVVLVPPEKNGNAIAKATR